MPLNNTFMRLALVLVLFFSLIFTSCSYLPWVGEEEDDLAFEDDFPFEDEEIAAKDENDKKDESVDTDENDFFAEDSDLSDEKEKEDGFASLDQDTDKGELKGDVDSDKNHQLWSGLL